MANYLTYDLEVLANSSAEINQIAERLKQPSTELVNWVAEKYGESVNEIAEHLRELVAFEATSDAIATGDPEDGPQMRNFEVSFKNNGASGLVDSHLFEVSKAFPKPVLLLEYYDEMTSYSGKMVIRAGKIVQSMYDGYHRAQAQDWVLLDIFRPFRIEHENGLEFGSLWQEWLNDIGAAVQVLKCRTNGELVEAKRLSHELFARNAKFLNAQFSKFYEEEAKNEAVRAADASGLAPAQDQEAVWRSNALAQHAMENRTGGTKCISN